MRTQAARDVEVLRSGARPLEEHPGSGPKRTPRREPLRPALRRDRGRRPGRRRRDRRRPALGQPTRGPADHHDGPGRLGQLQGTAGAARRPAQAVVGRPAARPALHLTGGRKPASGSPAAGRTSGGAARRSGPTPGPRRRPRPERAPARRCLADHAGRPGRLAGAARADRRRGAPDAGVRSGGGRARRGAGGDAAPVAARRRHLAHAGRCAPGGPLAYRIAAGRRPARARPQATSSRRTGRRAARRR